MTQRFEIFTGAISQIYRCIQKLKAAEMTEMGLKGGHVSCLFQLNHHPEGLTAAELCALCDEDKAAVSRTVADLEERGLVACRSAAGRRYRSPLTLTDAGREAADRVDRSIRRIVDEAGQSLTDAQRNEFYRALLLISANLQQLCGKYEENSEA
ncbi:MarR family winged helix-turn-helix transcriptional regulator [Dysosmobacter sp.]|uniref:MarR family winged helix-turn-helix transcriptional regulator n=1 Tax=Dysosmobacter sp. TaxID=2591382 RepID=UPI002A8F751E|nr:MarR family winged helix-turn-helix transcriptional regulator [Dysosmobacter sp.]MDY3282693.1 MarR family winged helix-turn-helix transcriptional regulator [Dysosmobacter sp.]